MYQLRRAGWQAFNSPSTIQRDQSTVVPPTISSSVVMFPPTVVGVPTGSLSVPLIPSIAVVFTPTVVGAPATITILATIPSSVVMYAPAHVAIVVQAIPMPAYVNLIRTISSDKLQYLKYDTVLEDGINEFAIDNAPIYPLSARVYVGGTEVFDFEIDEEMGIVTLDQSSGSSTISVRAKTSLLTDAEIEELYALYPQTNPATWSYKQAINLTAADCLDIIASSEALIQKKMTLLDIQTDGPALAKALRDHAQSLRDRVEAEIELGAEALEIIEMVFEPFGLEEKLIKDLYRQG